MSCNAVFRVLSLMALTALGCASSDNTSSSAATKNAAGSSAAVIFLDDIGLSYTIPTGWDEQTMFRPAGVRAMYKVGGTATVALTAKNTTGTASTDLAGQMEKVKAAYQQQFSELKILDESDVTVGPDTGRKLTVEGKKLGLTFRTTQIIASHSGRSLAIVLVGRPAEHDAAVESVLTLAREVRWK